MSKANPPRHQGRFRTFSSPLRRKGTVIVVIKFHIHVNWNCLPVRSFFYLFLIFPDLLKPFSKSWLAGDNTFFWSYFFLVCVCIRHVNLYVNGRRRGSRSVIAHKVPPQTDRQTPNHQPPQPRERFCALSGALDNGGNNSARLIC